MYFGHYQDNRKRQKGLLETLHKGNDSVLVKITRFVHSGPVPISMFSGGPKIVAFP